MYCLQWLIPVLLLPKPLNPPMLQTHAVFMMLYLAGFFLERKPCTICSIVFLVAAIMLCYSGLGSCIFWSINCDSMSCDVESIESWSCYPSSSIKYVYFFEQNFTLLHHSDYFRTSELIIKYMKNCSNILRFDSMFQYPIIDFTSYVYVPSFEEFGNWYFVKLLNC